MSAAGTQPRRQACPIGHSAHERRVARIAGRMFEALADLHDLSPDYSRILEVACLVHDAAKSAGDKSHHLVGAQMVLDADDLDLTAWERRAVAFLVRYHKGAVPALKSEEILRPGDGRRKMRLLLAILRAADSLDNRKVRAAVALKYSDGRLTVNYLVPEADLARAEDKLHRKSKFDLLEELFAIDVRVRFLGVELDHLV